MQTNKSYLIALVAVIVAIALCFGLYTTSKNNEAAVQNHKIGVIVYDINDDEVQMFKGYYENYISESFPVEFIYSASVSDWNDEQTFIKDATALGAEGFISFYATNLTEAVKLCQQSKVYYMMGSGNVTTELFNQVSSNPYFLGCIGPDDNTDYQAGVDMAKAYYKTNSSADAHIVVATGGSNYGNHMHEMRAKGILETLAKTYGYKYNMDIEKAITSDKPVMLETGISGITVAVCPGYDIADKLETTLKSYNADAVLSVMASDSLESIITEAEKSEGHDIWFGLVDCFSQWNYELFNTKDSFGNSKLNYISGKYASEVGPSFAAMFEAVTTGTQNLRQNGKAFHINQGFWTAASTEEFNNLYAYTQSYALNAYCSKDIMDVLTAYNSTADFKALKTLTEAYDIDSALKRMEHN